MSPLHPSQIERSISRLNETDYGTPRANSDDFRRIINASISLAQENLGWEDDAGQDNGSDVPSDAWMTTAGYTVPFDPQFCFQDIGYFLKDVFGGYAVAGSSPYVHTFTPQDMSVSRQMPSRTYLEKIQGLDLTRFTSIVPVSGQISWGKMGRIATSFTYEASGKRDTDPAGYSSPSVTSDREWGYASQIPYIRLYDNDDGTAQVETATAVGTATGSGNITVTITSAQLTGSPIAVVVAITSGDTPSVWAPKVRTALRNHQLISTYFDISGATDKIVLTSRKRLADDATLNIAIAAGSTGITAAPTSTDTTAGIVGDTQEYTCDIETGALAFNLPPADPGYRTCSAYRIADQPRSGQIRSELLVGARSFGFNFGARLAASDKTRGWMENGTDVTVEIPIIGTDSGNSSLRFLHTRGIIKGTQRTPNMGGFIGITGTVDFMSNSGSFPFSAVLQNDVASYAS